MNTVLIPNRQATTSIGQKFSVSLNSWVEKDGGSKGQETIWRLQDKVKVLQEELVRTRRALEQREILLRNSRQRELELRAEFSNGNRCRG